MPTLRYLLGLSLPFFFLQCSSVVQEDESLLVDTSLRDSLSAQRLTLPNGWSLTPAGQSFPLGDFPMNMAVSHDQRLMAITNNGQSTQQIFLFDIVENQLLDSIEISTVWLGIHFAGDDQSVYVSGGNDNVVKQYAIQDNRLSLANSIIFGEPWPNKISIAGIDLNESANHLYAVTKEDSALYIVDLATKEILSKHNLPAEAYTCLYDPARQLVYISLWGGAQVVVFNPQSQQFQNPIAVETHPNDMMMTQDGKYLFVANANANSVSVIDLETQQVIETIATALYPDAPAGSTSNSVTLSEDEETLFIANADNNCLAVFDVAEPGESESLGFIPTGWYPTAARVANNQIMVTNGKGTSSHPNPNGPNPYQRRTPETQYIARLMQGTLSVIDWPKENELSAYSEIVYENTPYTKELEMNPEGEANNPIPQKVGDPSPIKHVFYVIKENRTYDQVLGDLPQGNGDSSICLFPREVTPNHHKLAEEFVLLDNFYVDAEVSADGHNWSMGAYATDFVEKTWPTSYGGRGGTYDYEGSREIAYPDKGYIWDFCQRAGVSYRSYGEFVDDGVAQLESLEGNIDADFPGYNLRIMDTTRLRKWIEDFDSLVAVDAVPQFQVVRFGNDHTAGARLGYPTPRAMVADNDLAIGLFVEHISNSPIWNESAIFIIEDDAQNGPDHVDAHRSVLLIASPYTKRNEVVSTMYSTTSVLRTMELILGLPPMSQYDAAATFLWECFTENLDASPFIALPNQIALDEMNTAENELSRRSERFDLSEEDNIPDNEFSEVIWKTVRGIDSEMPAPRKSAFVRIAEAEEE
ncbi:MAG: bifunctional YncE family protein/alkaline phosphatase family protein [Cyclobacteriaceae bacterium]